MTHRPLALWLLATLPAVASAAAPGFLEDDVEVLWTSTGVSGTLYGWVTAPVPDLDGDGAPEVLLSAPAAVHGDGRVVLLSGRTGEQLFDFLGTGSEALGEALADAGDVDGDGLHDVILGAPGAGAGAAYVFSGADGSLLLSLAGERTGDRFGATVAGLGDMDGDGRSDIAVGAPLAGEIGAGVVTVYVGATGDVIFSLEGEAAGDDFGDGVDEVGDLDLDGVPDLVVGAPDAGASDGGAIYVYAGATGERLLGPLEAGRTSWDFGKWFVDGPGDLDGDGVPDVYASDFSGARQAGLVLVFSGADGSELLSLRGASSGSGLGCGRGAGDVDFDGVPDLVLGAWGDSTGAELGGQILLYSGTGELLRSITSTTAGENLGFDAIAVGDVDGDGGIDFLGSAATGSAVYLILGTPPDPGSDSGGLDSGAGDTGAGDTGAGDTGEGDSPAGDPADTGEGKYGGGCSCSSARARGGLGVVAVLGLIGMTRRRRGG